MIKFGVNTHHFVVVFDIVRRQRIKVAENSIKLNMSGCVGDEWGMGGVVLVGV